MSCRYTSVHGSRELHYLELHAHKLHCYFRPVCSADHFSQQRFFRCVPSVCRLKQCRCAYKVHRRGPVVKHLRLRVLASLALSALSARSSMTVEHAVGESVVVPGLKLTDHTFQVFHRTTGFFRCALRDTVQLTSSYSGLWPA